MCGLAGFIDKREIEEKKEILMRMERRILHRGPDSGGYYADETAALCFRRLSILDLDHGSQPMYSSDQKLLLLFNGEIYNFMEIKEELIDKGYRFATHSDTEVLLHGYEEFGKEIVHKLRGMFAFVVWNTETKELFGARDIFGIKPFYYYHEDELFLFGSEIKSFLEHPSFPKEMNKEALKPYLTFQYSVLNETFFKGVYKLKPGHCFSYRKGKLEIKAYHEFCFQAEEKPLQAYMDELESGMKESVAYHKISDVRVGSFLSGGVDSSYISELLHPNQTFSVGFAQKGFDESHQAKALSALLGIENKSRQITADDFFDKLPEIQYYSDEPHANLSAVPLYFLAELAREHVTVVLSGEGADELFGGYDTYKLSALEEGYRKLPKALRSMLGHFALHLPKFRGREFLKRNGLGVEDWYIGQAHIFDEKEADCILKDAYRKAPSLRDITKPYYDKAKDQDELTKKQYLDLHLWQPNDILLKADKMTMAHSLELRVPFLDKEVLRISEKLPAEWKVRGRTSKYLLRKCAEKTLPAEWAKRKKKGFPVPFSDWIREERYYRKVRNMFNKPFVEHFFEKEKLDQLLDYHFFHKQNNGRKIYTIYAFLVWYEAYFIRQMQASPVSSKKRRLS